MMLRIRASCAAMLLVLAVSAGAEEPFLTLPIPEQEYQSLSAVQPAALDLWLLASGADRHHRARPRP